MTQSKTNVIVVGAGIFGVTAALELNRRGYNVTLIDPGPLPHPLAASTDISKVIRMDYGADELYMALMEEAFKGWDTWNREWDVPRYHQTGFLIMRGSEMQPTTFEGDSYVLLQKRGYQPQRLDSTALKKQFPAWHAQNYVDGYFNPRAGWAESGQVVAKLVEVATTNGVILQANTKMARLLEKKGGIGGIVTDTGEKYEADFVIIAAGAWTSTLHPSLQSVMSVVGQPVLHFRPDEVAQYQPPHFVTWAAGIAETGWYGFPALADGTLKVANHGPGIPIHPDEPREIPPGTEARFREFFKNTFPGLVDAPLIGTRLCLYCDTCDGDFWIDHDPDYPGLLISTGGSGHGFKFGPVLGKLAADVLEGKSNMYTTRFSWREPTAKLKEDARYMG